MSESPQPFQSGGLKSLVVSYLFIGSSFMGMTNELPVGGHQLDKNFPVVQQGSRTVPYLGPDAVVR